MDLLRTLRFATIITSALLFAGCAGPKVKEFSQSTMHVKTIGLLAPKNPKMYWCYNGATPSLMFGAIGALAGASGQADDMNKFNTEIQKTGFNFSDELTLGLTERLEASGYTVVFIKADRENGGAFFDDYTKFDAQTVDAYLDLSVQQVGYMSHSMMDSPFKPDILLGVQLVDRTGKQLYEQHFLYGVRAKPNISATHIDADPSLFFSDYDAVMRDPKAAVKGLRSGIDTLTQRIAYDLHKS